MKSCTVSLGLIVIHKLANIELWSIDILPKTIRSKFEWLFHKFKEKWSSTRFTYWQDKRPCRCPGTTYTHQGRRWSHPLLYLGYSSLLRLASPHFHIAARNTWWWDCHRCLTATLHWARTGIFNANNLFHALNLDFCSYFAHKQAGVWIANRSSNISRVQESSPQA